MEKSVLKKYFSNKKCLIYDPSTPLRSNFQRIFRELGVSPLNIQLEKTAADAFRYCKNEKPQIIVANNDQLEGSALDLYQTFESYQIDRLSGSFFLLSKDNSLVTASVCLEKHLDGFLTLPLNFDTIKKKIAGVMRKKASPTEYAAKLERGKQYYKTENWDQALSHFIEAATFSPRPCLAYFFQGETYKKKQEWDNSLKAFQKGIDIEPKHYKCLKGLADLNLELGQHHEAYRLNKLIFTHYPMHPNFLPDMIRLSIKNHCFDDIYDYVKVLEYSKDLTISNEITYAVAASLIISAKHYFTEKIPNKALKSLKLGYNLGKKNLMIVRSAMHTLYDQGLQHEVDELVDFTYNNCGDHYLIIKIEDYLMKAKFEKALDMFFKVMLEHNRSVDLYLLGLKAAKGCGKSADFIDQIALEAISYFPEQRVNFSEFLA